MANIQPFDYQKRTNIEEHNQLVDKVNEIVDVINNANLETIGTDLNNLETRADKTDSDLASVQAKDITQDSEIADLKPRVAMTETEVTNLKTRADKTDSEIADLKPRVAMTETEVTNLKTRADKTDSEIADLKPRVAMTETEVTNLKTRADKTDSDLATVQAKDITQDSEIDSISKSLVSNVVMSDGTTMGSVQVSIEREDGALITSKNYKWGRDIGIRLEAGTQVGYVKAVIDLSDGTVLESNEYRIVEVLESDIYVTAITLVANQTDGTLGGNISYSNGTTQSINTVSVPTAPGVTTALESLQSRMTAVEQKNTTQDGQITALDTRVKAIEDTPGVGQFDTGKLGTIAGTTVDGRIKAESDGSGSVNGWSALKDRVTATEGQIVTAQNDIADLKSRVTATEGQIVTSQNDIADLDGLVAGKVEIMQGAENAGKALVVGSDGNVTPGEVTGGEVWEEIDLLNWPRNWVAGDRIKIQFKARPSTNNSPSSWTSAPSGAAITENTELSRVMEFCIADQNVGYKNLITFHPGSTCIFTLYINYIPSYETLNSSSTIMQLETSRFNGGGINSYAKGYSTSTITNIVNKMWRLKKS